MGSDIDHWERTRKDLRACRQAGAVARRNLIIKTLSQLLVEERRKEYFEEADKFGSRGASTVTLEERYKTVKPTQRKTVYTDDARPLAAVAALLDQNETRSLEGFTLYIEKLVSCQSSAGKWSQDGISFSWPLLQLPNTTQPKLESSQRPQYSDIEGDNNNQSGQTKDGSNEYFGNETAAASKRKPGREYRYKASCLLCDGAMPARDLTTLRNHYENAHQEKMRTPCSRSQCKTSHIITGWNEWVAHIERYHGFHNAPKPRTMVDLRCLLCDNTRIVSRSGLSLHTASCHSKYFEPPRPCSACPLKESADDEGTPMISSLSEWCSHVALAHGGPQGAPSPPSSLKVSCLLCEKEVVNELTHYTRKHATAFDNPFPCPECNRQCVGEVPLIADRDDWELHCIIKHGRTTVVFGQQGSKLSRCLVCHRDFGKVADHFTKAYLSSLPFACRECERLEPPEKKVQIQDRDEWVLHCATVHADVSAALSARTATTQSKRKRKAEDDLAWEKKVKLSQDRGVSRQDTQKLQSVPTCFICAAPNLAGYGDKIQVTFKRWEDL